MAKADAEPCVDVAPSRCDEQVIVTCRYQLFFLGEAQVVAVPFVHTYEKPDCALCTAE